jgi:beta-lactamase class A
MVKRRQTLGGNWLGWGLILWFGVVWGGGLAGTIRAQSLGATLRSSLERRIAESGAETVGLSVYDLETGESLSLHDQVRFHAASTMKVPVMMEIFRLVEQGELALTDRLPVKDQFASIIDGSPYRLQAESDSDGAIYREVGKEMTVRELVGRMIVRSSNLATNLLIERVGAGNVTKYMRRLGAEEIEVLRGVEDTKAFQAGRNNTTTARDLQLLLRAIAEEKPVGREASAAMVEILLAQEFNSGIPAGLPPGTRVAHKTGEITAHNHDAAIVYAEGRRPYVLVILTRGIREREKSDALIADLTRLVHRALVKPPAPPGERK